MIALDLLLPFLIGILMPDASSALTPGAAEIYATHYSIGVEWNISGDEDHDAICQVSIRQTGIGSFTAVKDLYRVDFAGKNMLAGSILFLTPGTSYEVRLQLSDPDGGAETRILTISTKAIPVEPSGGNIYHVIPGNGGGSGTETDPFQGVDAAEQVAQPGDQLLLHAGNYGGTIFFNVSGTSNQAVVWKAAGDGEPIFEGIRIEADYLWFEGIKIVNQQYGLRTSPPGPKGIVIQRCTFFNNHYSIYLNDGGEGWYIADNSIIGDNIPGASNFSGEGIELWYTSDHTVAHNQISRVADGISYPGRNVDMFGNEIFDTSDDGIEFDYGHANNRAWKNRITNVFNNGISFQPMNGAPFYVLYNQVSVLNNENVLKLRTQSDRALIAHNTFLCNSGPVASGSNFLVNFEIKNNLWVSIQSRYAWENGSNTDINWKTDFDYNAFDWQDYPYAFKWGNRLDDITQFYNLTGQEQHGIAIDYSICLDSVEYSESNNNVDSFYLRYYILDPACAAKDGGVFLPGINDQFLGSAPDIGAYEVGLNLPHYGIRPSCSNVEVNVWQGPSSAYWHDQVNHWSLGRLPTSCDHILVSNGSTLKIENGKTGYAYSLEVEMGAQLITEVNAQLTVINP